VGGLLLVRPVVVVVVVVAVVALAGGRGRRVAARVGGAPAAPALARLGLAARPVALHHRCRRRVAGGDAGQGGLDCVRPVAGGDEQAVDGDGAAQVVGLE